MRRLVMVCARVRRIGRLFSVLLLLWTAVDLVEHFSPDRGPKMTGVQVATAGQPSSAERERLAPHPDHSFCCSHTVDVKTPFAIAITPLLVGLAPEDSAVLPFRNPTGLYHPPLA
jgi:hypothetical protein